LDSFNLLKLHLERERSEKLSAVRKSENPVEQELMERELELLDAQIGWIEEIQNICPSPQF
jgi:hypothetical protein